MLARLFLAVFIAGAAPALAQNDPNAPYLFDLMKQPAYLAAWKGMVAGETVPPWVVTFEKTLNGTATPSKQVPVGGEPYTLAWVCKPHDCGDNQLYVLFAPGARQAWGLLVSAGNKRRWLGKPDAAVQAATLSGVQ
jgi:hypothetical protein